MLNQETALAIFLGFRELPGGLSPPNDYPWTAIANFSHDICFLGKALSPKGKLVRSLIGDLEAMF